VAAIIFVLVFVLAVDESALFLDVTRNFMMRMMSIANKEDRE
jgi:hypothetical protein